jgi:hypothetical protein
MTTRRHGTNACYSAGCRTEPCVEAHRRYVVSRYVPRARPLFGDGPRGRDGDVARFCEDRDDPADPRRGNVAILHVRGGFALSPRSLAELVVAMHEVVR